MQTLENRSLIRLSGVSSRRSESTRTLPVTGVRDSGRPRLLRGVRKGETRLQAVRMTLALS